MPGRDFERADEGARPGHGCSRQFLAKLLLEEQTVLHQDDQGIRLQYGLKHCRQKRVGGGLEADQDHVGRLHFRSFMEAGDLRQAEVAVAGFHREAPLTDELEARADLETHVLAGSRQHAAVVAAQGARANDRV